MQDPTPRLTPWLPPWLLVQLLLTSACGGTSPARPSCTGLDVTGPPSIHGRVVYQGAGVQGQPVSIAGRETTSRADGTFSLDAITPGRQPVAVGSGAFDSAMGEATLVRGENHLLIPIVRALNEGVVAGRTLDGCIGRPLAGVAVTVGSRTTTTDVTASSCWRDSAAGRCRVWTRAGRVTPRQGRCSGGCTTPAATSI